MSARAERATHRPPEDDEDMHSQTKLAAVNESQRLHSLLQHPLLTLRLLRPVSLFIP